MIGGFGIYMSLLKGILFGIAHCFKSAPRQLDSQTMNNSANNEASEEVAHNPVIVAQSLQEHIPSYLTADQKTALTKALSRFPTNAEYYLVGKFQDELLQGDGWEKLQVLRFDTGEKKSVLGIILSNTCDVAPENPRDIPLNIVFAPIIPLSSYTSRNCSRPDVCR